MAFDDTSPDNNPFSSDSESDEDPKLHVSVDEPDNIIANDISSCQ